MLPDPLDPPLTDDDLEAYFAWADQPQDDESPPVDEVERINAVAAWSVCDTGSAEWALRKLAHSAALIAQRDAEARDFHAQIDRWLKGEVKQPQRLVNFLEGQLVTYARRKREEDGDKTVKLPSGEVTSRLNPARPEVTESEAFVEWARTTPMVKAKWSPVMAEVKKRVTFEQVLVPDYGTDALELVPWPDADGAITALVAVSRGISAEALAEWRTVPAENLPNFHAEVWPICEGQRVPGVVEVPEEVTYTVKPSLT